MKSVLSVETSVLVRKLGLNKQQQQQNTKQCELLEYVMSTGDAELKSSRNLIVFYGRILRHRNDGNQLVILSESSIQFCHSSEQKRVENLLTEVLLPDFFTARSGSAPTTGPDNQLAG